MKPVVRRACGCEHTNHFVDVFGPRIAHKYAKVPAGTRVAMYVGHVCDECAATCMAEYVIPPSAGRDPLAWQDEVDAILTRAEKSLMYVQVYAGR